MKLNFQILHPIYTIFESNSLSLVRSLHKIISIDYFKIKPMCFVNLQYRLSTESRAVSVITLPQDAECNQLNVYTDSLATLQREPLRS